MCQLHPSSSPPSLVTPLGGPTTSSLHPSVTIREICQCPSRLEFRLSHHYYKPSNITSFRSSDPDPLTKNFAWMQLDGSSVLTLVPVTRLTTNPSSLVTPASLSVNLCPRYIPHSYVQTLEDSLPWINYKSSLTWNRLRSPDPNCLVRPNRLISSYTAWSSRVILGSRYLDISIMVDSSLCQGQFSNLVWKLAMLLIANIFDLPIGLSLLRAIPDPLAYISLLAQLIQCQFVSRPNPISTLPLSSQCLLRLSIPLVRRLLVKLNQHLLLNWPKSILRTLLLDSLKDDPLKGDCLLKIGIMIPPLRRGGYLCFINLFFLPCRLFMISIWFCINFLKNSQLSLKVCGIMISVKSSSGYRNIPKAPSPKRRVATTTSMVDLQSNPTFARPLGKTLSRDSALVFPLPISLCFKTIASFPSLDLLMEDAPICLDLTGSRKLSSLWSIALKHLISVAPIYLYCFDVLITGKPSLMLSPKLAHFACMLLVL